MLMNKRTGNTPKVPPSRFNIDAHYHKNNDRPGSFGVLGGYFLNENLSDFDPGLFGMTPIEAMWSTYIFMFLLTCPLQPKAQ